MPRAQRDATWRNADSIGSRAWRCGYCDEKVASGRGFHSAGSPTIHALICPHCAAPTFIDEEDRFSPLPRHGATVSKVDPDVEALYDEARDCYSVGAHTAAIMLCRKILMHVAVDKGAEPNKRFVDYVDYLADNHHIPEGGRGWVDYIREKGNDANHEIVLGTEADSSALIDFVEMLLKVVYTLPAMIPGGEPAGQGDVSGTSTL